MLNDLKIPFVVFLSSWAALAYEVLLTRIFSISLWYHFAFMIISIAMLGFAASGVLLALHPGMKDISRLPAYSLWLAVAITGSYLLANMVPFDPVQLSWEKTQFLYVALYYLILALPFFCAGLLIATAFATTSHEAGLLYGADLLGAGLGSLGVLFLLGLAAPERLVYLLAAAALIAPLAAGGKRLRRIALLLIAANLAQFFWQPRFALLRVSPYKGLPAALRYPGARPLHTYFTSFAVIDTFTSPAVRFAPGLSLRYQEPLPEQIGFAVDKGGISAVTSAADPGALAFLDYLPSALPYALGKPGNALLLDPGGGLPVLVARRHGAISITRVESSPALVEVIHGDFRTFSGDIYGELTWTGLGRSWLQKGNDRFRIIDLSLMGAEPAGAFGIAEDYRYTVEAFKEYLRHLEDDGLLSVNLYIIPPPRTELRLLATIVTALEELGVRDAARHVAAVRSWGSVCLVVKKTPLSAGEIAAVRRFARERWFDPVHLPGLTEEESNVHIRMPSADYFAAFRKILNPAERRGFTAGYIFDIAPVRDDGPFFHYHLKLANVEEIYRTMGRKWEFFLEEGYLLPAVFLQATVLGLILVLLPALAGTKGIRRRDVSPAAADNIPRHAAGGTRRGLLPYFALLGVGYMFVEIALVQKVILPLENPSHAMAAVLASLLVSSGAGSLLSQRFAVLRKPPVCAAIAVLIVIYSGLLSAVTAAVAPFPLPLKMALLLLFFAPPGMLMGMPFPTGLRILGEADASLIPWAWAINGSLSVLAPLLAVMFAMQIGFSRVLLLGALAYFLAFLVLKAGARSGDKIRFEVRGSKKSL
jgi:hypothetical protein